MDPLTMSVLAPIFGGLAGRIFGAGDDSQAMQLRQQALERIGSIGVPSAASQMVNLSNYQNAGELNPELEQLINQGSSAMNNVSADPAYKQAQMEALTRLQGVAAQGGMTADDRATMSQIQARNSQQEQAQRGALMQQMAARGLSGSGAEMAAQMQAQQMSANRRSQESMDVAGQAQRRALDAMMASGQMASQMRGQSFGEQSEAARAQDMISGFNARNAQALAGRNADRINSARGYNVQNQQDVMNRNTGVANTQEMHNTGQIQQNFENRMNQARAMSGEANSMAGNLNQNAQNTRNLWGGIGQGVGQGITAYNQQQWLQNMLGRR